MPLSRRFVLALAPALAIAPLAVARAADPRLDERAVGSAGAPVSVMEFFSLTCPHCARFARDSLPEIQAKLIDTGKLRYVFRDYPLDQVALMAAQVAHALPPDRYEPFTLALLAAQDRWAFARGVDSRAELGKMAALAGLSPAAFNAAVDDAALRDAILARQDADTKAYGIDSTPSFVFNGANAHNRRESGEMTYAGFAKVVAEAGPPA